MVSQKVRTSIPIEIQMEIKIGDYVGYTDRYLSGFSSYVRRSRFIMKVTRLPRKDKLYIVETQRGTPLFVRKCNIQKVYQLEFDL